MRVHRAIAWPFHTSLRIPAIWIALLAASALIGNVAQWIANDDLKAADAATNAASECRSRIIGYVDGLSIEQDSALGVALLDRTGASNDEVFREARKSYEDATARLTVAKDYRERAVEVCDADPDFEPQTDIPQE